MLTLGNGLVSQCAARLFQIAILALLLGERIGNVGTILVMMSAMGTVAGMKQTNVHHEVSSGVMMKSSSPKYTDGLFVEIFFDV